MAVQKSKSRSSVLRFVLLFVGLLLGAIFASAVFLIAGSSFAMNGTSSASVQAPVVVTSAVTGNPAIDNPEVQIYVDQAYVSKIVNNEIKKEPDFSNAVVDLRPPNLALITLDVRVGSFITVRPTVTLAFEASNNQVQIQITRIEMGGFSVPLSLIQGPLNNLTQMTQQRINALTDAMQQQTGLELTRVSATDTDLVLNLGEKQLQPAQVP